MKRVLPCLLLLWAGLAQAEMYKWVGPDGKITYSDVPPPNSVKQVETKRVAGGYGSGPALPFELAEISRNFPVTLYTTEKCQPCDEGRALLKGRGIPFSELTVNTAEDQTKMQQSTGERQLPLLMVGRTKHTGFLASDWNGALTASGYPNESKLPPGFQYEPPQPASPPVAKKEAQESEKPAARPTRAASAPATAPRAPAGDAPPGFRF